MIVTAIQGQKAQKFQKEKTYEYESEGRPGFESESQSRAWSL